MGDLANYKFIVCNELGKLKFLVFNFANNIWTGLE